MGQEFGLEITISVISILPVYKCIYIYTSVCFCIDSGVGTGGQCPPSPMMFQCTLNELVLYIVHSIAFILIILHSYIIFIILATRNFFGHDHYLLITLSLWMEFQSNKLTRFKHYVRFLTLFSQRFTSY